MKEKILTQHVVDVLGLDKLSVITANMLDGFTSIVDYAFYGCSSLSSVTIPNSVTSIGSYAFSNCTSLSSVTIPNSVTHIGVNAFGCCRGLTAIEIPNSVTCIGNRAFNNCWGLTTVEIPNSVTSIGHSAFSGCENLTSVVIPDSVKVIGVDAFHGCGFEDKEKLNKKNYVVAYKGFDEDMSCRGFQYKEGETYEIWCEPKLCKQGFHACLNPLDCLNYYWGEIEKDIVFHEVYLEGVSDEKSYDSKVVAKKITIGRKITISEMADIASRRKQNK